MLQGLINEAETAADAVVAKYAVRASVVVPFLVALAFATLAITLVLTDRYGATSAFTIVAIAYGVVGVLAALSVVKSERDTSERRSAVQDAAATSAKSTTTEVAATVLAEAPLALAAGLLSNLGGPTAALDATRALVRNWPLVVLAGLIGVLVFSTGNTKSADDTETTPPDNELAPNKLNGARAPHGHLASAPERSSL